MQKMIPYSTSSISQQDIVAVAETLKSDMLTTGPKVVEFEKAFAKKIGTKYAVAVNSGTAALHCANFAIGIKPGDEVIVPAITFVATSNAVKYCGAKVVFADVDPNTLLIDVEDAKRKLTNKTRAIVGVDYAGQVLDYEALRQRGIWLIADACHSLVHSSYSNVSCHSFHAVKHITTGEGGMVATNDYVIANRARAFRNHGRFDNDSKAQVLGYNYRLSDIQCALGLSQLDRLDEFIARRQAIAKRYDEAFKDLESNKFEVLKQVNSTYHLYILKVYERDKFRKYLLKNGIGTQVHYQSLSDSCPVAMQESQNIVSIPCFPGLEDEQQDFIIETIRGYLIENHS